MRKEDVINSPLSKGRTQYLRYLEGEQLKLRESIQAKCFECNAGYIDGREDCKVVTCPLYGFMDYNPNKYRRNNTVSIPDKENSLDEV